jgi:hypothetical protein
MLKIICSYFQKLFSDFELQGVPENTLNSKTYETICSRLQVEEATQSVTGGGVATKTTFLSNGAARGGGSSDSD